MFLNGSHLDIEYASFKLTVLDEICTSSTVSLIAFILLQCIYWKNVLVHGPYVHGICIIQYTLEPQN